METTFSGTGYSNVFTLDGVREEQAATDEYAVYLCKFGVASNQTTPTFTFTGQSTVNLSDYPVYLQVYNQISGAWETLDSDSATAADTNFTLTGSVTSNRSNYYTLTKPDSACDDGLYWVSFRVYQNGA